MIARNTGMHQQGFEVITAKNTNIAEFQHVTLCNLVDRYLQFGGICCLYLQVRRVSYTKGNGIVHVTQVQSQVNSCRIFGS
jgi:hypothetical protein